MGQPEQEYKDALDGLRFSDKEKERIMKNLMEAEQQGGKGKRFPMRAAMIAAALAVVCLLSAGVAASLPDVIHELDDIVKVTITEDSVHFDYRVNDGDAVFNGVSEWPDTQPIQLKDGRLWLVEGGKGTDITDLIDEDTPMCQAITDPDTGKTIGFFAVGGTPEDFGHVGYVLLPNGHTAGCGLHYTTEITTYQGVDYEVDDPHDLPEEVRNASAAGEPGMRCATRFKPWVITAVEYLGIDWLPIDEDGIWRPTNSCATDSCAIGAQQ